MLFDLYCRIRTLNTYMVIYTTNLKLNHVNINKMQRSITPVNRYMSEFDEDVQEVLRLSSVCAWPTHNCRPLKNILERICNNIDLDPRFSQVCVVAVTNCRHALEYRW